MSTPDPHHPVPDPAEGAGADWTTQIVDAVDQVVDVARERAVEPIQTVGRGIVYGLVAAFFFGTAAIIAAVGLFRALDNYLPTDVWVAHALVGGIFTAAGLFTWTKRKPQPGGRT